MLDVLDRLSSGEKNGLGITAKETMAWRSYAEYFKLVNPAMKLYPHTKLICNKLQKIADGEQHFYIISMPPQHGKSLTVTKTFPSYFLMKYPNKHAMIVAYSQDLYSQFAASNRRIFTDWSNAIPPSGKKLSTGKNTSQTFNIIDHRGGFYATSVLGGATGMSADLLIIDDPIKNAEKAASPTIKEKIWNEWNLTFYPRLQKGGSVIVIMTRWQTDDLAGRLLSRSALPWEEIKLPAIAYDIPEGKTDAIGRHNGDPLCPELHSKKELLTHKHDMGSVKFQALYQQSPIVEGGNIFKREWFHFFVPDKQTQIRLGLTDKDAIVAPRHFDEVDQSWDATFEDEETDDFVAGQLWKRRRANRFLFDEVHARLSFTRTVEAIREMTRQYPDTQAVYIEDKANGSAIIDTLKNEIAGIVPVTPGGSKPARAAASTVYWEAGNVYIPHPKWKPWVNDYMAELLGFPNYDHDDRVDSSDQYLNQTGQRRRIINRF